MTQTARVLRKSEESTAKKADTVTIVNNRDGMKYEFPIVDGSLGPSLINIGSLYRESGMFTYDPGFTSTGSCSSEITFIDGEEGILLH